jgi:hypothetical protein
MRALVLVLGLLVTSASAGLASDLFVDTSNGSLAADGLSWTTAKASIREALSVAAATPEADTVRVAEGVYREHLTVPPDVALLGGHPPGGGPRLPREHETVIEGDGSPGALVTFPRGSDGTTIDGFTIRRATSGAVRVDDAAPLDQGNLIEDNFVIGCGTGASGVFITYTEARAAARLRGNVFRRNRVGSTCRAQLEYAGAVFVLSWVGMDVGTLISGDVFEDNGVVGTRGGAAYVIGRGRLENLVVRHNYRVDGATNRIVVTKDLLAWAPRLDFGGR